MHATDSHEPILRQAMLCAVEVEAAIGAAPDA
jgi:hypothetical protein